MPLRAFFRAILFVSLAQATFARDHWISLRTPNFELFTESDEKPGREALKFFEEVRSAFTDVIGLKLPGNKPITIIAFRDENAFAPYRPQSHVVAYMMSFPGRDYIIMQDLNPATYPVALHEFTHVMITQAGLKLPVWLNEGFAELYATLTPAGGKIRVGRILPGRLQNARTQLLDLRSVLNADHNSPLYHEIDRVGIFYAESWALVHMLKFSDAYSRRFDKFLDAIGRGQSSEDALQVVYGKNLDMIFRDLVSYVNSGSFREGVIKARLDKTVPEPQLAPVDPVDMGVLLAGIEARGSRRPVAIQRLKDLAVDNPSRVQPLEALAWIELLGSDPVNAIEPFRKALALGTRDANLCLQWAMKLQNVIPDTDYVAALRRATEIDPNLWQAQGELATHAYNAHDYKEAILRLHAMKKMERGNALPYYRMLAVASLQIGNLTEAKSALKRAESFATTPEEKRTLEEIRKSVEAH